MMIAQKLYEGVELGSGGLRRVDHLHAYRLDARLRSGARRSARLHRPAVRRQLSARKSRLLPFEERRAGRARSDPPDRSRTHAGFARAVSRAGRAETLSADLAALRRVADDARRLRSNDDRHQRRTLRLPRHWFGAEVRRLPRRSTRKAATRRTEEDEESDDCRWSKRARR